MATNDLKKISVQQLRLGMYVHEFCGSWMEHPFWRSKFLLRTDAELARVVQSGITELWIDPARGCDVEGGQTAAEVREQIERELEFVASMPMALEQAESAEVVLAKATALYRRSVPRIASMFNEARLGRVVNAETCLPLVDEISESVLRNPGALISVVRLKQRDDYTYMHSVAVCALMTALGRQLGLEGAVLRQVGVAGMLHDIGKIAMPVDVLNKPGKLTDAEFAVMKTHPEQGHAMLAQGGGVGPLVLDVCLHHHEHVDASGYPHGLSGDKISLFAKMGAVCDVYDAVTSTRPYKAAWDPGESLRKMAQWKGHFEPRVFQAFVKAVGIYPTGTLVRLQSGRLAVVTAQNPAALLTPRVKVFFSLKSNMRIEPVEIDLASAWSHDKVAACESPEDWPFKDLDRLAGVQIPR